MSRLPPMAWTDLSNGATRQNIENILQFSNGVTVYFDGEPVAVIQPLAAYCATRTNSDPVAASADAIRRTEALNGLSEGRYGDGNQEDRI